ETRHPSLAGQAVDGSKEPLHSGERFFAFQPDQLRRSLLSGIVPATGNIDFVFRDILGPHELESSFADQLLVDTGRAERKIAGRAAGGELLLGYQAGHHNWVGVEHAAAGPQDAAPLHQQRTTVEEVAHYIHADNYVERLITER